MFFPEEETWSGKEMEPLYNQLDKYSYKESLKALEADIQYANTLAASIPRAKGGARVQMKLVCSQFTPLFLFLLQWMDFSCACLLQRYLNLFHIMVYKVCQDGRRSISSHGRKATIGQFYAVILPSLQQLNSNSHEGDCSIDMFGRKRVEEKKFFSDMDLEREDECGICMEPCSKMLLPTCCHTMCINCYHDWNTRSASCPFCRGSIKRVKSGDLWVLTSNSDVVDKETVAKEDLLRFYLYIDKLPKDIPDTLFLVYYEYLI
ncbi:E3 ubiquitin-protein ligase AIRP2-like [Macadamia integrifolia]|uniref:E3 ubiquitin-protein ligase AIRP2-like n=1 Tax=Macadamia integrifolia TaxID=60698 RepID=UPI001C4FF67E|nr:E3 ubiquitin-protein ligase AIRP2-like [Macadamia integrifolia]